MSQKRFSFFMSLIDYAPDEFHCSQLNLMLKLLLIVLLFSLVFGLNYPMFKQCDAKWAHQQLGTSPTETICSAGCLMSSASMALNAIGNTQFNPSTLNKWLTSNQGYARGDLFIWASVNQFGMTFIDKVSRDKIKSYLDGGYIVIPNVHNGRHWVLATSYKGDSIMVNDPGFATTSYTLDEIVQNNTGVYSLRKITTLDNWYLSLKELTQRQHKDQGEFDGCGLNQSKVLANIRSQ